MAARPPITGTNEMALNRNRGESPMTWINSPATAGPTRRAALNTALFRPTAFASSSVPTISITNACRVGRSTTVTTPRRNASTSIIHTWTTPVSTIPHIATARTAAALWVQTSVRRLSRRSARTPPHTPKSSMGRNWSAIITPRATPLSVSLSTNQLEAGHDAGHGGGLDPFDGRQLAQRHRPQAVDAGEGGDLGRGDVAVGLLAQAAGQAHDRQAEAGGHLGVGEGGVDCASHFLAKQGR